jgi:hypothetical protein
VADNKKPPAIKSEADNSADDTAEKYKEFAAEAASRLAPDRVKLGERVLKLDAAAPGLVSEVRQIFEDICNRFGYQAAADLFEWTTHVCRPQSTKRSAPPTKRSGVVHNELRDKSILELLEKRELTIGRPISEHEFAALLVNTPEKCRRWGVKDIENPSPKEQILRRLKYLRSKRRTK